MVASSQGSVFAGKLNINLNNLFSDVWLQIYINERFEYNFGTAISMEGKNVPITIIEDSYFYNNFFTICF